MPRPYKKPTEYRSVKLCAKVCVRGPLPTLDKVSVNIAVVLGTSSMPVHQVLRLGRGAIIELDASEEDEVNILANNLSVAKGTVIFSGNKIAVEVKELLPRSPEAKQGARSPLFHRDSPESCPDALRAALVRP